MPSWQEKVHAYMKSRLFMDISTAAEMCISHMGYDSLFTFLHTAVYLDIYRSIYVKKNSRIHTLSNFKTHAIFAASN